MTRALWWHDLVDWARVGPGPRKWDWHNRDRCASRSPDGRRCALPWGHVAYLGLGHQLKGGRSFVRRVTPYWPSTDPKRFQ